MKIAAIIPVKPLSQAKTRLQLGAQQKEELCKTMLEEILHVLTTSPKIDEVVVVTREQKASDICKRFNAKEVFDTAKKNVNDAVSLADRYLLENKFDASIVLPQDIPFIKTQDIDFMLQYMMPPNFAIVVPSRKFDGTNALVRMPVDLMETHYDEDSYKIHVNTAKERTLNASLVFVKRIMWDVDNNEDLEFMLQQNEKPYISEKIRKILGQK